MPNCKIIKSPNNELVNFLKTSSDSDLSSKKVSSNTDSSRAKRLQGYALRVVGEEIFMAGKDPGEEKFHSSLAGVAWARKIAQFFLAGVPWRGIARNFSSPGSLVFHPGQTGDTRD